MRSDSDRLPTPRLLLVTAAVVSLVLSLWISSQQVIINPDAICYLKSASVAGESGVRSAMALCGQASWPFYSIVISYFSKLSFLSMLAAANMLDAIFTMISVLTFIAMIGQLGGSRRVLWLAAFVILSAHQFNAVRQYIIRDHGFWAFYLASLFFMLRFVRLPNLKDALGFSASLSLAALFRIEGGVFLVFLPLLAWITDGNRRQRMKAYLQLNMAIIAAAAAMGIWMLTHPQQSLDQFGRLPELLQQFTHGFALTAERFQHAKQALVQYVLPYEAARDAGALWAAAMVSQYVLSVIGNLSWLAAILVGYVWLSGAVSNWRRSDKFVVAAYLLLNFIITALFYSQRLFLSKRYLIAFTLVFLLYVPFALEKLLQSSDRLKRRAALLAMIILFVSSFGTVFDHGSSRQFVRDAGAWAVSHIPADARVYSNDVQVAYYSEFYGNDIFKVMNANHDVNTILKQLQEYDYAVLRGGKGRDEQVAAYLNEQHVPVMQEFVNRYGDHIKVYKISQQSERGVT